MAWRPHPRKAQTDPSSPSGWSTCMRCGFIVNLRKLINQHDWRGLNVQPLYIFVCDECLDREQRQLGSIILPPDPPGLLNARPEAYPADERWSRLTQDGAPRYLQTQNGTRRAQPRTLQYSKYFT